MSAGRLIGRFFHSFTGPLRVKPRGQVRPQLTESRDRCQINHCIYGASDNLGCSGQ